MLHYRIDKDKTGKLSIPDGKKFDTLWQVHVCPGSEETAPELVRKPPEVPAQDLPSQGLLPAPGANYQHTSLGSASLESS